MCERIQVLVYTFSTQQPLLPFGHLHARAWGFFVLLKAILVDIVAEKWLISAPGCSLSAGRAVSLLAALKARLRGHTCPASPAGVEHPSAPISYVWFFTKTFFKSIIHKNKAKMKNPFRRSKA
ncbi:hypothetical protein [Guptibacillus hwajinpoensis]|uniref:hypothetical protein n=1 Tax=Guptibacillus hwajinpoensis TaxID=208199 RepID=UPI0037350870